jgi:hypothetical protein
MGINMSKTKEATAVAEPYISEYDQYAGTYKFEPLGVETEHGFFAVDRAPTWLIEGQKVLVGGLCEYASAEEANQGDRVPIRMTIKTLDPL